MIVIKTDFPEETFKIISDLYLIQDNYLFYSNPDEVDEDYIITTYGGRKFKNKMVLTLPLLILTNSEEVVDFLDDGFVMEVMRGRNEVECFIRSGFLPIDEESISLYVKNNIEKYDSTKSTLSRNEHYVFHMFKDLGYLKLVDVGESDGGCNHYIFEPTEKLIDSLIDTEYITPLIILKNNFDKEVYSNEKYIHSLYQILKLIDVSIFTAIEEKEKEE